MAEFNLKSGNATPFKLMGSSPVKQAFTNTPKQLARGSGDIGKRVQQVFSNAPKQMRGTTMKNIISAGKQFAKFFSSKALGVLPMMIATSSKADQPTKGKGKVEYPGGKIDFTK
jgi:hypothetical protein